MKQAIGGLKSAFLALARAALPWFRQSRQRRSAAAQPPAPAAKAVSDDRLRRVLSSAGARQSRQGAVSPADRQFMNDLLTGLISQVQHEQDLIAARGKEPVSVRLVPQVPVRNRSRSEAWIGGGARLPAGMAWPEINGSALQLLAQIDCARLPAGLWEGHGPRQGWLALFLDPKSLEAKVFHFADAGEYRPSPPVQKDWHITGYDGHKRAEESGYRGAFHGWPVDIVPVVDGKDDPRHERQTAIERDRYARPHDLVTEPCWPFDWTTARLMMDMAVAAYESCLPKEPPAFLTPEALARAEAAIAEAEASGADSETLAEMRVNYDGRRAMATLNAFARENGAGVVDRLRALKDRVTAMASSETFSTQSMAPVLAQMQAMTWMHKSVPPFYRDGQKLSHSRRLAEGVRVFTAPLTTHDPSAAPSWVYDFETRLIAAAKPVYLETPAALPPSLIAFCERIWADEAACEMAGMGHVPWRFVQQFDDKTEVTLVELPTCYLVGWMFGDVDNLVITIRKTDLARNDFSKVRVQITN